ncbi:hypothetical protein DSLASN_04410 [Desulfoluna limicola]|uniref:Uncharacterized protein n=1 Tax=Desulfoluna limicola TaxID=2810562 RepID=A0ABM7PCC5_9BACT|nr:hypothetical protein [Desulfoluna limicola]BCS94809.1 hypothetical protein DSLASN_04410 [Desulfoluna limicola]
MTNTQHGIWHHQRRFILGYVGIILIPLAILIGYFCYDKGLALGSGPVTITLKWSNMTSHTSSGGIRGGGNTKQTSYGWDYHVWGETETGQRCFIDVDDLLVYNTFTKGEVVDTAYTFHKEKGDWRWTWSAKFILDVWVWAFLFMLIRIWIKENGLFRQKEEEG